MLIMSDSLLQTVLGNERRALAMLRNSREPQKAGRNFRRTFTSFSTSINASSGSRRLRCRCSCNRVVIWCCQPELSDARTDLHGEDKATPVCLPNRAVCVFHSNLASISSLLASLLPPKCQDAACSHPARHHSNVGAHRQKRGLQIPERLCVYFMTRTSRLLSGDRDQRGGQMFPLRQRRASARSTPRI